MIYGNYVITKKVDLNLPKIYRSCTQFYNVVKEKFGHEKQDYSGQATLTTKLYSKYNLLMYPFDEFHQLYFEIQKLFHEAYPDLKDQYYIQCWLNLYQKGDFIDWHRHWTQKGCFHGFYCVNVETEPSATHYRIEGVPEEVIVPSKNNQLVISPSDHDLHRSTEWNVDWQPRITIAYDIVPRQLINPTEWLNHWIPI